MPGYQYKGTVFEAPMRPKIAACGTYSGYRRHLDRKEQPCHECRLAGNTYKRQYRRAKKAS
jgi:hypothetical protein